MSKTHIKQSPKGNNRALKYSFTLWLLTFLIFVVNIYRYGDFLGMPKSTALFTLIAIPIGVIAYIMLIVNLAKILGEKFFPARSVTLFGSLIFGVLLLMLPVISLAAYGRYTTNKTQAIYPTIGPTTIEAEISPTIVPTTNYVQNYYPTTDPNPIINCNIHANCGGGTKPLRQSVCNNSTCCQIGNNWYYYEDKGKCSADQADYYKKIYNYTNNYGSTYSYPTLMPYPTYAPMPTVDLGDQSDYSQPAEIPYQQPRMTRSECISNVNDEYRLMMTTRGCSYPCPETGDCGSTSVCDAIWYQAQQDMANCEQYP